MRRGVFAARRAGAGIGIGVTVMALITSPGLRPASARGRVRSNRDDQGPDRAGTVPGPRRPCRPRTSAAGRPGRRVVGRRGQGLRLSPAAGGARSTSKVIGLPALLVAEAGQSHRVEVVVAVDLDDPVPLAEPGLLGGRTVPDRVDRLGAHPEPEVDESIGRQRQLEALQDRAVLGRCRGSPLDDVHDRPIEMLGQEALILSDSLEPASAPDRRARPPPGCRPSSRPPCLRAGHTSAGRPSRRGAGSRRAGGSRSARSRWSACSFFGSRRGWMSISIGPS